MQSENNVTFKAYLKEMTMKAGDLNKPLRSTFDYFSKDVDDTELLHIGDIDDVKIMRFEKSRSTRAAHPAVPPLVDFFIKDNDKIGMMMGHKTRMHIKSKLWDEGTRFILEFDEWFILPQFQRTGLGEKYLYFLKNVMKTPVLIGNIHSLATQEFLKKHAVQKRFKMNWYNVKTGETEDFSQDKYSTDKPNEWQVLIESDSFQVFDQFKSEVPSIRNTYEWLFTDLEKL